LGIEGERVRAVSGPSTVYVTVERPLGLENSAPPAQRALEHLLVYDSDFYL